MKRIHLALIALAGAACLAAGCSNNNGSTGNGSGGNPDMGVSGGPDMTVLPPPLYYNPDDIPDAGVPSDTSCLGHFADPPIAAPGTTNAQATVNQDGTVAVTVNGLIKDFQDSQPIGGADIRYYLTDQDVLNDTPFATLKQYQTSMSQTATGTNADGTYTIKFTLPNVNTTRVIIGNRDGFAMGGGNMFETIPTYEFDSLWSETAPTGIKLATKQAIPGLVSVTQKDGLGVLAGGIRDCQNHEVGGAIVQVTGGPNPADPMFPSPFDGKNYDGRAQDQIFYFAKIAGSTLPTRVQKWTSGNAAVAALNVPPGEGTITVSGVVTAGGPLVQLNSAQVPVIADAVTIVNLPPK